MMGQIRVLLADDHPLFQEGVKLTLEAAPDIAVIGQVGTGDKAAAVAGEMQPDILLLDITMPGGDGLSHIETIQARCPHTKIVMFTASEDREHLMTALKAGARGFILKGVNAQGLLDAVRKVAGGDVHVSPSLAGSIFLEMTRPSAPDPLHELTEREREVLQLVGEGLTNREIGRRLHLAEKTIKHYMTNVLQKLRLRSRVEAALLAQRRGLCR